MKGKNTNISGALGKLQPQALELEEAVLGALMIEKDALNLVIDILRPESFYKIAHQEIYQAIFELFSESEPIDMLTVTQRLRKMGKLELVGGPSYIMRMTASVNSAANIEYHSRIITEQAIKRELINISSEIQRDAFEDATDVFDLLDQAEQKLFQISESNIRKNYSSMNNLMRQAIAELEARKNLKDGLTGVPTGFVDLDRITAGFQKSDLIIVAARPAMGKCLGKGTKVLMYDGTLRQVEDIEVGDLLMGDDSTSRKVLSTVRGKEKMYWIRQNKGIDYRVNESHILSLKRSRSEGSHKNGDVLNISVREYINKSTKFKSNYKGYKVAVEFSEKSTTIEPYFLGLWLGDGRSSDVRIASQDPEIVDYLNNYAEKLNLNLSSYFVEGKCPIYAITTGAKGNLNKASLQKELRDLQLLDNKHIPENYLINSTKNRLELLAGLIDSDGHYLNDSNGYEITFKNENLAKQLKFLCDSLGFRSSLIPKKARIRSINFESDVYRVRFFGDVDKIPVKVIRKKAVAWRDQHRNWHQTGITVEYDKIDDYYGFVIDGNHLFVLEDMTVTHNTAFSLSLLRNAAVDFNHPVAFFSLEMSEIQIVNRLISGEAELESEKIKRGNLAEHEWHQLYQKTAKIGESPIFIDDSPALSILELRAKCRRLKAQHDIQMIIVDYLQLMTAGSNKNMPGNREQEISTISRGLKNIAKELNVPVIALSQLSRAVETRGGDKKPQLSDLRESGCLSGDTLILNSETGERIPIKTLAERQNQSNFKCMAVNPNYKLSPHNMFKVFYSGKKEIFELKTKTGRTIKASGNHPFLKLSGWTHLEDLKIGDKIAVPRKLNIEKPSNPLTINELILLAHLLGDGCILPSKPYHYTSADWENIEIVKKTAQELFGIEGRIVPQENWWHVYLTSPYRLTHNKKHPITLWYEKLGIERVRSYDKKLPESIFQCDNEHIALFIKHLWATDGNISWKKNEGRKDAGAIYYASTSQLLVKQIQHLLLRLGIISTQRIAKKEGYRHTYQLHIQGVENQIKFLANVGCFGNRGKVIPEMLSAFQNIQANPNDDIIPQEAWQLLIEPLKKQNEISWRNFAQKMEVAYNGSGLFKHGISRPRMEKIAQALPFAVLKNLAESDVLWDEIISINSLGVEDVYDASVAEVHNFVAEDFIVHNSIEQDADIVLFLYRPEYYGITQDMEGNPTTNVGEVIVAKHRNGSLDTVKLKFIGKFTKFENLDNFNLNVLGNNGANDNLKPITLGSKVNNQPQFNTPPTTRLDDEPPF
jgi:replicative DNA helicase